MNHLIDLKTIFKKNILIIGASAQLACLFIEKYGPQNANFFGISSKFDDVFSDLNITIFNYLNFTPLKVINFDEVLILASRLPHENISLQSYLETNFNIMNVLKEILISNSKNTKITFTSTYSLYSPFESFIDENSKTYVVNDYCYSKLEIENDLANFANNYKFNLLILRIPTLIYKGATNNYLTNLRDAIKDNTVAKLYNPTSALSKVIDVENIVKLFNADWNGLNLVNCSSMPDITFSEIGALAKDHGLSKLFWVEGYSHPQRVNSSKLLEILGELPSARKIINNWFKEEFPK